MKLERFQRIIRIIRLLIGLWQSKVTLMKGLEEYSDKSDRALYFAGHLDFLSSRHQELLAEYEGEMPKTELTRDLLESARTSPETMLDDLGHAYYNLYEEYLPQLYAEMDELGLLAETRDVEKFVILHFLGLKGWDDYHDPESVEHRVKVQTEKLHVLIHEMRDELDRTLQLRLLRGSRSPSTKRLIKKWKKHPDTTKANTRKKNS